MDITILSNEMDSSVIMFIFISYIHFKIVVCIYCRVALYSEMLRIILERTSIILGHVD